MTDQCINTVSLAVLLGFLLGMLSGLVIYHFTQRRFWRFVEDMGALIDNGETN
jgi:hypothetical protein